MMQRKKRNPSLPNCGVQKDSGSVHQLLCYLYNVFYIQTVPRLRGGTILLKFSCVKEEKSETGEIIKRERKRTKYSLRNTIKNTNISDIIHI